MRKILSFAVAAAIAANGPAALAQDDRPRDSGGFKMDLSEWHFIPKHEFMLNILDLPGVEHRFSEGRLRHKSFPQHRMWFDSRAFIFVEHINVGVYRQRTTHKFQSFKFAEEMAERYWNRLNEPFGVEDKRKIYISRKRGGWALATRGRHTGRLCFFARLAFLSQPTKSRMSSSQERYDTGIHLRDCSGKRSLDDVATWLEGAYLVGSGHNRVR